MDDRVKLTNETHDYDGHLRQRYIDLVNKDKREHSSFDDTLDQIFFDLKRLRDKYEQFKKGSNAVLKALTLLNEDRKENYDSKNDIHVEELLPRVWTNVKEYDDDGKFIFYEQVADILLSGKCAQGRTTRLLQFYH